MVTSAEVPEPENTRLDSTARADAPDRRGGAFVDKKDAQSQGESAPVFGQELVVCQI
jgi:hypothetical protein